MELRAVPHRSTHDYFEGGNHLRSVVTKKSGLLLSFSTILAACVVLATSAYAQDASAGRAAFQENCGFCHGTLAQGNFTVPMLAGAAGHTQAFGIPPQAVGARLQELVRQGIPERMPMFPPDILSDADVQNIAAYLLESPPATGTSIFISRCSFCHGLSGEGNVGPPLADAAQLIAQMGWTDQQATEELGNLVHGGIPGRMPQFPSLTEIEVARLVVALVDLPNMKYWESQFTKNNGHTPTLLDRMDYAWALEFQAQTGRAPTAAEVQEHSTVGWRGEPQGGPGGPPGGGPPGR